MQQMEKMRRDAGLIRLGFDASVAMMKLMPVEQHRGEGREQPLRDRHAIACITLRFDRAEYRAPRPEYIHRMRVGRRQFQGLLERNGQATLPGDAFLEGFELRVRGQLTV